MVNPSSILRKSIFDRYMPDKNPVEPTTAQYRLKQNASCKEKFCKDGSFRREEYTTENSIPDSIL